jgi:hypothetical protein
MAKENRCSMNEEEMIGGLKIVNFLNGNFDLKFIGKKCRPRFL